MRVIAWRISSQTFLMKIIERLKRLGYTASCNFGFFWGCLRENTFYRCFLAIFHEYKIWNERIKWNGNPKSTYFLFLFLICFYFLFFVFIVAIKYEYTCILPVARLWIFYIFASGLSLNFILQYLSRFSINKCIYNLHCKVSDGT